VAVVVVLATLSSFASAARGSCVTLAATARCLKSKPPITRTFGCKDALHVTLRDRAGPSLSFYTSSAAATAALRRSTALSKSLGVKLPYSVAHVDKNVFVSWETLPSAADARIVEDCLR